MGLLEVSSKRLELRQGKDVNKSGDDNEISVHSAETHWPQNFRVTWVAMSLVFAIMVLVGIYLLLEAWSTRRFGIMAGFGALTISFAMISTVALSRSGIRSIGLSRRIQIYTNATHGRGIVIPSARGGLVILITLLVGVGLYGILASAAQIIHTTESLLPAGRDSSSGALIAGAFGITALILAILVFVVSSPSKLGIHPDGILRTSSRWRSMRRTNVSTFVPWDRITDVVADALVADTGWVVVHNPMIKLTLNEDLPSDVRTRYDGDRQIAIQAYTLSAEPNTLLALIFHLHENPDDRKLIDNADAVELLRPPPLFERFRSARAQKSEARSH